MPDRETSENARAGDGSGPGAPGPDQGSAGAGAKAGAGRAGEAGNQRRGRRASRYETLRWRAGTLIERALGRAGGRFAAYALALPDIVYLYRSVLADPRVSRSLKGELIAEALYLVSPVDVVPEALLGPLGVVDDALVAARLFDALLNRVPAEVVTEHWPGDDAVLEQLRGIAREGRKMFALGFRFGVRRLARQAASGIAAQVRARLGDGRRLLEG